VKTDTMTAIELGVSNFDGEIDPGFAEALRAQPGAVFGHHCGQNFCGRVFYEDGQFREEVQVYGRYNETISAPSLPELMERVNDEYE